MVETTRHLNEQEGVTSGTWGGLGIDGEINGNTTDIAIENTSGTITAEPPLIEIRGTSTSIAIESTASTIDYEVMQDGSKVKVYIRIPRTRVFEGESFTAHVQFRTGRTAVAPTSIRYRVDCLESGEVAQDWTTVTAAAEVFIPVAATVNAAQHRGSYLERKQLTVEANSGTDTAHRDSVLYRVENIRLDPAA